MFERFTDRARDVLVSAQEEALAMGHNFLGTEHLLLGLLRQQEGVAGLALSSLGVDIDTTRADIREIIGGGRQIEDDAEALRSIGIDLDEVLQAATDAFGAKRVDQVLRKPLSGRKGPPPFVPRAKKVMELSLKEALQLGHNYIGTEHLLLGILREGEGVAAQILVKRTPGLHVVKSALLDMMTARRSGS